MTLCARGRVMRTFERVIEPEKSLSAPPIAIPLTVYVLGQSRSVS